MASASCGARPAYIAWKEKIRWVRGSRKNWLILVWSRRKAPAAEQLEQVAGEQVGRRVQVAVDEVGALQPPQLARVVDEPQVAVGLAGPQTREISAAIRAVSVMHVERRAVRVVRPVGRVERGQVEPVVQLLADRARAPRRSGRAW